MNDFNALAEPIKKLIELNKTQFEKLAAAQQESAKNYIALTEARIKAASTINDPEALKQFTNEQIKLAQSGYEKMVNDGQSLFKDAKDYNEQLLNIIKQSSSSYTDKK
ncbi:MAG: phasin family protein [Cycloclasticus sp.]|nr:phasin family protein [Cycloclasticus sp.]MBQ0790872.1 phasin family protein [Cycloclasticus sp.]